MYVFMYVCVVAVALGVDILCRPIEKNQDNEIIKLSFSH